MTINKPLIMITIDGPAGAGKGTVAHRLAQIYNLSHLDTGLLYRAVAFKILKNGDSLEDEAKAIAAARKLDPQDLEVSRLREETFGNAASIIGPIPEVRQILNTFQRHFAYNPPSDKQGVVLDGRDIGAVVLPESPCKIFVTASPEVRATRRLKELKERGISSTFETLLEEIKRRDMRDSDRKISPLKPAEDAFILDTSTLRIEEAVDKACEFVDLKYSRAQKNAP